MSNQSSANTHHSDEGIAIKVGNVSKVFKLPHEKQSSVKGLFVSMFNGKRTYEKQQVLKGVSFEIKNGEFFGIVGRNGSGKSTLLKLLAGIYEPDSGYIQVNGKLTPFIELGVGFNQELTGRENVFLNGALLGFNRKEMDAMYAEIVEFAELEKFMDQKLKNYSSGMQVRLAFSIAIRAKSDILVLDEVLAVGDEAFQKKCNDYFGMLKKNKKTVVLVTHDMNAVRRFCDRAVMISDGEVVISGLPNKVANQYSLHNLEDAHGSEAQKKNRDLNSKIKKLDVRSVTGSILPSTDDFIFEISYELNEDVKVDLGISITYQGQSIIEHNTKELTIGSEKNKLYKLQYKLPLKYFTPKTLGVDVAIFESRGFKLLGSNTNSCSFIVATDEGPKGGLLKHRGEWITSKDSK